MLQRIGYRIAVDGDFGSASDKALRTFQTYWGLEVDGQSGPATRIALKNCVNAIESSSSKALRVFTKELGRNEANGEDDKYIFSILSGAIYSPCDNLKKFLTRSIIYRRPFSSIVAISPVENHPSSSNDSFVSFSFLKYLENT